MRFHSINLTEQTILQLVHFMTQIFYCRARSRGFFLQILADQLIILAQFLKMLIFFLQVVTLFYHSLDISFDLGLHLHMPLGLSTLLMKFLLKLLNFVGNLLFPSNNFIIFRLFSHEISSTIFNFISDLLIVLEMHFFDFPICSFNIVTELVRYCLFSQES